MPKQRIYCFTKPTEMHGVLGSANWALPNMREAINLGTGPWFCIFVDGRYRAAVEMSQFLIKIGFEYAYEYTKQEKDSYRLAKVALDWRNGRLSREQFEVVRVGIEQKYARNFSSRPLMVANRLAADNSCSVASAICIEGLKIDFELVTSRILDYAKRVIR